MATAVADPQTLSSAKPTAEGTPKRFVNPVGGHMNDGREDPTIETEQSLQTDQGDIVAEAKTPMPASGSFKFNEYRPMEVSDISPQVEEKPVTQEEMSSGWTIQGALRAIEAAPIDKIVSLAGNVIGESMNAGANLFTDEIFFKSEKPKPEDPEEIQEENGTRWVRQKQESLETQVENVLVQKQQTSAKDINRISEGQMTREEVIQEVLQGVTLNIEDPMSVSKVAYIGIGETMVAWKERQAKIKANQKAQAQETAIASGNSTPGSLTDQNKAAEGSGLLSVASGNAGG